MTTAEYLERKSRRSDATRTTYAKAEASFARCFNVDSPDIIVARIKAAELDAYHVLDKFVGWLMANGSSPKTVHTYLSAVKGLLRYEGVSIDSYQFKARVELPPMMEVSLDRIPTREEIRDILLNCDKKTRALVALLATTGLRIGEAAQLRVGNVDSDSNKITVMSQRTKTRRGRIGFTTDETIGFLRDYLGSRIRKKNDWLFLDERNEEKHTTVDGLYMNVYRVLRRLGLKNRLDPDSKRNELHPHSFRKYFFSKLIGGGVDRGIAERLMGHNFGFDNAYLHMDENRLRQEYMKAIEDFTFLKDAKLDKETRKRVEEVESENQQLKEKMEKMDQQMAEIRQAFTAAVQRLSEQDKAAAK